MPPSQQRRRLALIAGLVAACALAVAAVVVVAGDDDPEADPAPPTGAASPERPPPERGGGSAGDEPERRGRRPSDASPKQVDERRVERTVRRYVAGLNDRDGDLVCGLFVPGALEGVELPREGGDCGAALGASIGYRDPRGFPQWEGATVEHFASTRVEGDQARVTATIVSRFADRDEPSVEDDLIYLERRGERWLIVQPTAVLYRAIGAPDVPPEVLSPPN